MKLLWKNREQYRVAFFYIVFIWLLVSMPVFSKGFFQEQTEWYIISMLLVINVLTIVNCYFAFYKIYEDYGISAICTAMFTLSVYRYGKYMLERDMNELFIMAILPVIFYAIYELATGKIHEKWSLCPDIILILCYLLTIAIDLKSYEIVAGTVVIILLVHFVSVRDYRQELELLITLIVPMPAYLFRLSTSLSEFSLIQEKGTQLSSILVDFWLIKTEVMDNELDPICYQPGGIGLFALSGLFLFFVLWLSGHIRIKNQRRETFFTAIALNAVVLILMSLRAFPWDRIQLINGVTYRIIGVLEKPVNLICEAVLFLAICWGYLIKRCKEKYSEREYYFCVVVAVVAVLVSGVYIMDAGNMKTDYYAEIQMQNGIGEEVYVESED